MRPPILAALSASLVATACGGAANLPVELADVYTGPEGLALHVLSLAPRADGKRLIEVIGSGSDLDGKVLAYERDRRSPDRSAWCTKRHGRDFCTLHEILKGETMRVEVYLPGRREATAVSRDEAKSKALKPGRIVKAHLEQRKDGSIDRFARFDRPAEQAAQDKELAETVGRMQKACGAAIAGTVDWASITDAWMLTNSVSGWCDGLFDAAGGLCERSEAARATLGKIKELRCRIGTPVKLEGDGAQMTFTLPESNVEEGARAALSAGFAETGPDGHTTTLGRRVEIDQTALCTDGKSHYVASGPHERGVQLAYGDGKTFTLLPEPGFGVPPGYFLDPRHFNPGLNPSFRGLDLRQFSSVKVDEKTGACTLHCGARETKLVPVDAAAKRAMLAAATFNPPPRRRVPHALARDSKGVYYLVDKSNDEGAKDYRLLVGPKGNLKPQKMTNVVSDSEGEVFSTKSGSLRFVLGKSEANWIAGRSTMRLLLVPVEENRPMIYNELGVYIERLGTPCDDL